MKKLTLILCLTLGFCIFGQLINVYMAPVLLGAYYASHWLRFEGQLGAVGMGYFSSTAAWVVLIQLGVISWFQVHRGWRSFVTFYDLLALVQAVTVVPGVPERPSGFQTATGAGTLAGSGSASGSSSAAPV